MTVDCTARPDLDWHSPADYPRAAAICAGCELRAVCEAGARARGETWGMWGGVAMDAPDADTWLLAEMLEPAAVEVVHGKRGTGCHCDRCRSAHARYVREWRQRDVTPAPESVADQLSLWEAS